MAFTSSQVRMIIVIIVSCSAINIVLYASAVFSASRTDQRNQILLESEETPAVDDDEGYLEAVQRIASEPLLWNQKAHEAGPASPEKRGILDLRKGRRRYVTLPGSKSYTADSHRNGDGDKERLVIRMLQGAGGSSRKLATSSQETPSVHKRWDAKATSGEEDLWTSEGSRHPEIQIPRDPEAFSIDRALRLFRGCVMDDDDISIDCFNDAYLELSKLFKPLGTVFSFVTSEIQEKISILREYRKHPILGHHFRTFRSMIRYELDHNLSDNMDKPSGSRTFLRLHWALEFISALVTKISGGGKGSRFSDEAAEAYDKTLGRHHPWYMQKAVHLATYALPNRAELLVKLDTEDNAENRAKGQALSAHLDSIYDICQAVYAENHLEDLP